MLVGGMHCLLEPFVVHTIHGADIFTYMIGFFCKQMSKSGYLIHVHIYCFFVGGKLFFGICLDWCLQGSCFFLFSIQTDSFYTDITMGVAILRCWV